MSAGLCARFNHKFIVRQFDALSVQAGKAKEAHRRLLRDKEKIKFRGLNDAAELLQRLKSDRVIFAGSQFGPPLVSLAALASVGPRIAIVYWALSKTTKRILENCQVHTIDMTEQTSWLAFVRLLQKLQADGYFIWLMCDAPGKSRSRYDFLGYSVRCANLIEVYARIYDCMVIPTYCRLISYAEASLHFDTPLINHQNMTQLLLSNLEELIHKEHINYIWNKACIVFSDPRALQNGLRCLPDFLEWRDETGMKSKALLVRK
jgi:lauroyl/myristoyl acyltransferase